MGKALTKEQIHKVAEKEAAVEYSNCYRSSLWFNKSIPEKRHLLETPYMKALAGLKNDSLKKFISKQIEGAENIDGIFDKVIDLIKTLPLTLLGGVGIAALTIVLMIDASKKQGDLENLENMISKSFSDQIELKANAEIDAAMKRLLCESHLPEDKVLLIMEGICEKLIKQASVLKFEFEKDPRTSAFRLYLKTVSMHIFLLQSEWIIKKDEYTKKTIKNYCLYYAKEIETSFVNQYCESIKSQIKIRKFKIKKCRMKKLTITNKGEQKTEDNQNNKDDKIDDDNNKEEEEVEEELEENEEEEQEEEKEQEQEQEEKLNHKKVTNSRVKKCIIEELDLSISLPYNKMKKYAFTTTYLKHFMTKIVYNYIEKDIIGHFKNIANSEDIETKLNLF